LAAALDALAVVTRTAAERGLDLRTPAASEILTLRGVLESAAPEEDTAPLLAALLADLDRALAAFNAMRAAEGQALATVIAGQIGRIADLADQARTAA
ncbi:MAG: YicC family protein, partial [Rhodobacteraceae bacterium]|nr:YicC family protein [Paracoccaceae bacterium]